jgi:DNA-binding response OmpR family regulator
MILPGGKNGREVAEEVRLRQPGLPVLFMSGYTHDSAVFNGSLGMDADFLGKPFTPQRLLAKVRAALDREATTSPHTVSRLAGGSAHKERP